MKYFYILSLLVPVLSIAQEAPPLTYEEDIPLFEELPLITEEQILEGSIHDKQKDDYKPPEYTEEFPEIFGKNSKTTVTGQALIRASNKVTTKSSKLTLRAKQFVKYGNIRIKLHDCWEGVTEDKIEHAALLEVIEQEPEEKTKTIFQGWMFASSPGLSALEHPIYDIVILKCIK